MPEFSLREVAQHKSKDDLWLVVHGKVLDATKYLNEHPGGADVLIETAGTDASEAFDDAGHSQEAFDIMEPYVIGTLRGAVIAAPTPAKAVEKVPDKKPESRKLSVKIPTGPILVTTALVGGILGIAKFSPDFVKNLRNLDAGAVTHSLSKLLRHDKLPHSEGGGFFGGFLSASATFFVVSLLGVRRLAKMADVGGGFTKYPRIIKVGKPLKQELVSTRGFLDPKTYQYLPLVEKTEIAPDVFRLSFELPTKTTILGLPAGQHVAIKADINGQSVSRSYTPVSNNTDLGSLELVIRCYADGLLTGQYLRKLELGDEVAFRGPKGAMRYKRGLTKRIGMIAGGTGITPMYQLIRAICEDDEDLTEVSLIYANRSEQDVLLREELEAFARRYPKNFKLWYMLDKAPEGWQYGVGYVNKDVIRAHLPAPSADSKVMICGPPGMVNACKKALASVGFQLGGAVPKMTDQVFTF